VDAIANAMPDHDTFSAFARVRDCHAIHCGIVVAIFGTTDKQAAWRKNEKGSRPDSGWKLGAGMRDEISTSAASDLQCGFIWIDQPGVDHDQFLCAFESHSLGLA
jgi:hypothetical protein